MGQIRLGTASWTDRTLFESGWCPQPADKPGETAAVSAEHFPLVEVDEDVGCVFVFENCGRTIGAPGRCGATEIPGPQ